MKQLLRIVLVIAVSLCLACQLENTASMRSGTVDNAYVEEPLAEPAKKYEHALRSSNEVIDHLISHNYDSVYDNYLDQSLKNRINRQNFEAMYSQLERNAGRVTNYKRMQWGFQRGAVDGTRVVTSTKIVEHEKAVFNYDFTFRDDGRYDKMIRIQMRVREGQ